MGRRMRSFYKILDESNEAHFESRVFFVKLRVPLSFWTIAINQHNKIKRKLELQDSQRQPRWRLQNKMSRLKRGKKYELKELKNKFVDLWKHRNSIFFSVKRKLTWSRRNPLDADPPESEHRWMVINVQERKLIVLLAENKEQRVAELQQLWEVVPPNRVHNLKVEKIFLI